MGRFSSSAINNFKTQTLKTRYGPQKSLLRVGERVLGHEIIKKTAGHFGTAKAVNMEGSQSSIPSFDDGCQISRVD